jgi:hypothetical protein
MENETSWEGGWARLCTGPGRLIFPIFVEQIKHPASERNSSQKGIKQHGIYCRLKGECQRLFPEVILAALFA